MPVTLIPARWLRAWGAPAELALHLNLLVSLSLLGALFALHPLLQWITALPHLCLFEALWQVPCPGCDATAALLVLSDGQWRRALTIQPAIVAIVGLTALHAMLSAVKLCQPTLYVGRGFVWIQRSALGVLLGFWVLRLFNLTL